MPESPRSQRPDEESDAPESVVHPLTRIIAENGGTIASAYEACQRFLCEGLPSDEELRRRRKERRKATVDERDTPAREGTEPKKPRPKMHALDPGIAELEALANTLPWMAGIKPETCPTWRQAERSAPESLQILHAKGAFRKWAEELLRSAASL